VIKANVKVVRNNLPSIGKAIRDRAKERRSKAAMALRDRARQEAPVDTGKLRGSIEVVSQGDSTDLVVVGASYASFVNNGTRRMPANPFWDRAVEAIRADYPNYFKDLV